MTLRPFFSDRAPAAHGTRYVLGDSLAYGTMSGSVPNTDGPSWVDILGYTKKAVAGSMFGSTDPTAPEIFAQMSGIPSLTGTIIVSGGVNNIGRFQTAQQICRWFAHAEAMAWRQGVLNVLVMTITPFATSVFGVSPTDLDGFNVVRLEVNQWIRETFGPRGQCVDAIASVGGDTLVAPYAYLDGVHLTAAGQSAYASAVGPSVAALTL